MKRSILLVLSVAMVVFAKPVEKKDPTQMALLNEVTPSMELLYAGVFESTSNVGRWSIHLNPLFRVEAIIVENLVGCRITSIQSGIGTFALTLGLEKLPGPVMFFQYRFFGTVMPEARGQKYEPQVEIITV